jgi:hypothetical protein
MAVVTRVESVTRVVGGFVTMRGNKSIKIQPVKMACKCAIIFGFHFEILKNIMKCCSRKIKKKIKKGNPTHAQLKKIKKLILLQDYLDPKEVFAGHGSLLCVTVNTK